ncbi:hypothetical protein PISMIDRAFT_91307 [Pisolithus microcarpus 441]|uniref:Uncharacterized protein n=1 Tax=Pisolithus microcarpus 441 TaxID=765257 RepID=A0A0C9ZGS2_9AGAM|nr:hypothetical protein PISMIDRAFT_91307 [Pisolithus microcarpus 441]
MTAAQPTDDPVSLRPSFSRSQSWRISSPPTTRGVVTAPPWANEPPSPVEHSADGDVHGSVNVTIHRASTSTSSLHGVERPSQWWAFARPHSGGTAFPQRHGTISPSWTALGVSNRKGKTSDDISPYSSSITSPRPHRAMPSSSPILDTNRLSRVESQMGSQDDYSRLDRSLDARHDDESGVDRSTACQSRKGIRAFILFNTYVPLLFRFINITFTTAALALAVHIRELEMRYEVRGVLGSSPTLVIIFAPLTLVHVMIAVYLEYFGRPLGLWRTSGKLAHTLLEVCFICAWSAALSLCFDNFFTSPIPCASAQSIAWYDQLSRPALQIPGLDGGSVGETLCDSQLALIVFVGFGLIMYCINLVISLFRIFEKVKYHAGIRQRTS